MGEAVRGKRLHCKRPEQGVRAIRPIQQKSPASCSKSAQKNKSPHPLRERIYTPSHDAPDRPPLRLCIANLLAIPLAAAALDLQTSGCRLRTLLISVTKWGHVSIVYVVDSWRAYKKPAATRASWDDPAWESHIAPNMAEVFQEEVDALILPCGAGASRDQKSHCDFPEKDAKRTEGGMAHADTS